MPDAGAGAPNGGSNGQGARAGNGGAGNGAQSGSAPVAGEGGTSPVGAMGGAGADAGNGDAGATGGTSVGAGGDDGAGGDGAGPTCQSGIPDPPPACFVNGECAYPAQCAGDPAGSVCVLKGDYCDALDAQPCVFSTGCEAHRCAPPKPLGSPCTEDLPECGPTAWCDVNALPGPVCVPQLQEGDDCNGAPNSCPPGTGCEFHNGNTRCTAENTTTTEKGVACASCAACQNCNKVQTGQYEVTTSCIDDPPGGLGWGWSLSNVHGCREGFGSEESGQCQPLPEIGQACQVVPSSYQCAAGAFCAEADLKCYSRTPALGKPCFDHFSGGPVSCSAGSYCDGDQCVAEIALGQTCTAQQVCADGFCGEDGKCQAKAALNTSCKGAGATGGVCVAGNYCGTDFLCHASPAAEQACVAPASLKCPFGDVNCGRCTTGTLCGNDSVCHTLPFQPPAIGQACTQQLSGDGLTNCESGRCCGPDAFCAADLKCHSKTSTLDGPCLSVSNVYECPADQDCNGTCVPRQGRLHQSCSAQAPCTNGLRCAPSVSNGVCSP